MEEGYKPSLKPALDEYPIDYEKLQKANREKVVKRIKQELNITKGVLFLKGGEAKVRFDTDTDLHFRQESNFQYLFGASETDCFGMIDIASERSILFVPRLPEEYAVWLGEIHPVDYFRKIYKVDAVYFTDEAEEIVKSFGPDTVYLIKSVPDLPQWLSQFQNDFDKLKYVLSECRLIKSEEELKLLRYICKISSYAHNEVMKYCKPNMKQYELEAMFLHLAYINGRCRNTAYICICGTGKHAATLHYPDNDKVAKDGQIALLDMGAEYHCYCSDITCSYPVNGKFSEGQRTIYQIVLDAQQAVLNVMKPGTPWEDMHRLSEKVIAEGLLKAGFLKGDLKEIMENHIGALFFPHGLGHMLGLDTHDVGGYPPGVNKINEPGIKNLRARRPLEAGMVVTVEPGLYFIDALLVPALKDPVKSQFLVKEKIEEFLDFGGVRIEDDVIVTENGAENMTLCPRTVEDIETVMLKKDSSKFDALIFKQ